MTCIMRSRFHIRDTPLLDVMTSQTGPISGGRSVEMRAAVPSYLFRQDDLLSGGQSVSIARLKDVYAIGKSTQIELVRSIRGF